MQDLSAHDLAMIGSLRFDGDLKPSFDVMRSCLVWNDERPDNISPSGYEIVMDLWIARSILHRGQIGASIHVEEQFFMPLWDQARAERLPWPGLRREHLSEADRDYYRNCLNGADDHL